jgi:3-hydroxyisobutyrate dehydrogenase-like beta-hydroxyacid dehydrogenase
MGLALDLAEKCNATIDGAESSMQQYAELEKAGFGGKDLGYVFQYIHGNKKL